MHYFFQFILNIFMRCLKPCCLLFSGHRDANPLVNEYCSDLPLCDKKCQKINGSSFTTWKLCCFSCSFIKVNTLCFVFWTDCWSRICLETLLWDVGTCDEAFWLFPHKDKTIFNRKFETGNDLVSLVWKSSHPSNLPTLFLCYITNCCSYFCRYLLLLLDVAKLPHLSMITAYWKVSRWPTEP